MPGQEGNPLTVLKGMLQRQKNNGIVSLFLIQCLKDITLFVLCFLRGRLSTTAKCLYFASFIVPGRKQNILEMCLTTMKKKKGPGHLPQVSSRLVDPWSIKTPNDIVPQFIVYYP